LLQESNPLTEKFQNFGAKQFMWALIHVFVSSFMEIGKAEVINWCVVFIAKKP